VTHLATIQRTFLVNAQQLKRRGIDFGVNYRREIGGGLFGLAIKGSYLLEAITRTTPGIPAGDVIAEGNYANPRLRATMITSYSTGKLDLALNTRFISAARYAVGRTVTDESYPEGLNHVAAVIYNDMSVGLKISNKLKITLGVQNVLDIKPREIPAVQYGSGYYDTVGRYFFGSVGFTF
jgi:outer membrane receptor protein involved in Fe transport